MVGNCYAVRPDDEWNRPVDSDPVDYQSSCIIDHMASLSGQARIRLDVGLTPADTSGMPYDLEPGGRPPLLPLTYGVDGDDFSDESDWFDAQGLLGHGAPSGPVYFPLPQNVPIEGWGGSPATDPASGDRHAIVVDGAACMIYESAETVRHAPNGFAAACTAVWDGRLGDDQRPAGWTSVAASGTSLFAGLLRYAEVAAGGIHHALRFTFPSAQAAYARPGRHLGPSNHRDPALPFYGARFRLVASFDETPYSADARVLIAAFKRYGIIFADQGSAMFVNGDIDPGYATSLLGELNDPASSLRIPFDSTHWELVQPREPVYRSYDAGTVTCGGLSDNADPTWQPTWAPACPPQANWP